MKGRGGSLRLSLRNRSPDAPQILANGSELKVNNVEYIVEISPKQDVIRIRRKDEGANGKVASTNLLSTEARDIEQLKKELSVLRPWTAEIEKAIASRKPTCRN